MHLYVLEITSKRLRATLNRVGVLTICLSVYDVMLPTPVSAFTVTYFDSTAYINGPRGLLFYERAQSPGALDQVGDEPEYSFSRDAAGADQIIALGSTAEGRGGVNANLRVSPGIVRAANATDAAVGLISNPSGQSPEVRASAFQSINVATLDRLLFVFEEAAPQVAQISVTFAARVSTGLTDGINRNQAGGGGGTSWNFRGDAHLHAKEGYMYGNAPPSQLLQLGRWTAGGSRKPIQSPSDCNNIDACYTEGLQFSTHLFSVSAGNVLWLSNVFSSQSEAQVVSFYAPTFDMRSALFNSGVAFGESGYTLIDILTPGVSYIADSGVKYLTEIPTQIAVPEADMWILLVSGFGLVGGLARSRVRTQSLS